MSDVACVRFRLSRRQSGARANSQHGGARLRLDVGIGNSGARLRGMIVDRCRNADVACRATMREEILVPTARLELAQLSPLPPQDSVSTNFTTSAAHETESEKHEDAPPGQHEILTRRQAPIPRAGLRAILEMIEAKFPERAAEFEAAVEEFKDLPPDA